MISRLIIYSCLFFSSRLSEVNCTADGSSAPSSIFRDDVLFDIQWPGGYAKDLESKKAGKLSEGGSQVPDGSEYDYVSPELTDQLHSEVDYSKAEYFGMKSVHDEDYLCEMPHWTALDSVKVSSCFSCKGKPEQ